MTMKVLTGAHSVIFLLIATVLEVSGDAVVRLGVYNHAGLLRIGLFVAGASLLFGYGCFLNLAPLQFGQVAGLYIAMLFVVWQVINILVFRAVPTLPILIGGVLIIAGGCIVSMWRPAG
jgi:small multidrug resistance family-3 protein